jgi:DNA-binding transcriptional LysR family regulator
MVAPQTTVADVIAPFLAGLSVSAPIVDVEEALPTSVYAEVVSRSADVGVSSVLPPRELASQLIVHFPIWAYVRAEHPWARRRAVSLKELARQRLVVLGAEHGTRRQLDAAMAEPGLSYDVVAETNVPQVAQALAASGRGVAVASDDVRYGLHGVRIRAAGTGDLRVPLFGAWDTSHYAAAAIGALVEGLARYAQQRYGTERR